MQRGLGQAVYTDRNQYSPSRAVEITVQIRNEGTQLYTYQIGTRHEYELRIRESRSRKVVWTWAKGKSYPPSSIVRLMPGDTREHLEFWDRRDDSGRRVPAGVYEVELVHAPFTGAVATQIYLMDREQPGGEPPPPEPPGRLRPPRGGARMQATIQAERSRVRSGETVRLTYTVINASDQAMELTFPSSGQCDMEVRRRPEPNARYAAGALTVWQLSRTRAYLTALTKLTLAPGERKSFTEAWVVGNLAPGVYELLAWLPTVGSKTAEAVGTITVV